jgi:EF hand domain-containing protein
MKKLLAATVVALVPLAGIAAEADQNPDPSAPTGQVASFDALDTNKDGRISMPEASADPKLVENFSRVDKDGDGYLDSSEYANSRDKAPQQ